MGEDFSKEKYLEDTWTGGSEDKRGKVNVQRCKSEWYSCAKVQKWETELKGGSIGEPDSMMGALKVGACGSRARG